MADQAFPVGEDVIDWPRNFRKLSARQKRAFLESILEIDMEERQASLGSEDLIDLADVMVESAIGVMPVPLGIASDIHIDGERVHIPMAVEEPSVVAAATYAGRLASHYRNGIETQTTGTVMSAQVAIDGATSGAAERIEAAQAELHRQVAPILEPMRRRGGGFRGLKAARNPQSGLVVVTIDVDTQDAMGANLVNTVAEALRQPLEQISGGTVLMAILTNAASERRAAATIRVDVSRLARGTFSGPEMAHRIVRANTFALTDSDRAVTHNKGIMNGISSLALATGNDTRAVEAAAHAYAARDGMYRALTSYEIEDNYLVGRLEIPLSVGTVGGAVSFHPVASLALKILFLHRPEGPTAERLSRYGVALGLVQNLAALMALVGEGIQQGHMRQHARRLAWKAGARDGQLHELAQRVWERGTFNIETARSVLETLRSEPAVY